MRITALETYHVAPRWLFLVVRTDAGIDGYGEPIVEGLARTTEQAVQEMGEYLLGRDPRRIEHHRQALHRGTFYRGGAVTTSALSGIEQALWDITGKALGAPVYELLGGAYRDKIRMYAHVGPGTRDDLYADARRKAAAGFTAVKASLSAPVSPLPSPAEVDRQVEPLLELRRELGDSVDIAVDFHGRTSADAAAMIIDRLRPVRPMFVEEICLPENTAGLSRVAPRSPFPVAAGERLFTRWQFRQALEEGWLSILQPDLCHAGGIFEVRKIAAMAEAYDVTIAPHNPLGPISLAAGLQIASCTPNFLIQEHPSMPDRLDLGGGLLAEPFVVEDDGHIARPTRPGLGIELDLEAVRERSCDGSWRTPRLEYSDGGVAEW